jgi:ubiquinone/menaquinone biosynthesis C-methylase UbiE/uncharacterized protein YbaR (Trm112 family)
LFRLLVSEIASMLGALAQRLVCPSCKDPRSDLRAHIFTEGFEEHIRDGVLVCDECHEWYPIADDVLEFVRADLLYRDDADAFQQRFASELTAIGCKPHEIAPVTDSSGGETEQAEQRKQREHFDRYAEGLDPGFKDYTRSVFIRAASARFINLRNAQLSDSTSWILDIGCGTGISSFGLANQHVVAAFDISKKVIRRDTELARERGVMATTTFFVSDGEFLSFKDESFDFMQTFGALHHLPNPAQAVRDILRILKPGGVYFGVENNKTSLRWIFDLMMKIRPLWIEEAGAEPLISEKMLRNWAADLPADVHCETSVFLPPHIFNMLGLTAAHTVLCWSDRACSHVPWLRSNGGQLVYHMRKITGAAVLAP